MGAVHLAVSIAFETVPFCFFLGWTAVLFLRLAGILIFGSRDFDRGEIILRGLWLVGVRKIIEVVGREVEFIS